jgi:iron(III) transport system substrate-binding protein
LTILTIAAAAVAAGSAAAADLDNMSYADLVAAAAKEGKVTVYSFTSRIAKVEEAFEKAYPGIDLIGVDISSTEQIARLAAEQAAGIRNADVAFISDTPVVLRELVAPGYLQTYVPPRLIDKLPKEMHDPLLVQRLSTKVLMYNEEASPDGPPVNNLWQLTLPEWKGRVIMVDPLQRGDYLDLMTEIVLRAEEMAAAYEKQFGKAIELKDGNRSAGEQWIADLFANDVVLVSSTDDVNAAVGKKGQTNPPIGFSTYSDRRDNEEEGWALQVANGVEPSPGILFPAAVAVVKDAPNPAAARLAIDFLMGDDSATGGAGYKPFYVAGDYAARSDIAPHPDAIPLAEFRAWRVDPAATVKIRQEVGDLILRLQ